MELRESLSTIHLIIWKEIVLKELIFLGPLREKIGDAILVVKDERRGFSLGLLGSVEVGTSSS